ncbi:MAG TPA: molybdopterin-dependent oxidoreductase [Bryobacteraceae bacterium]|jgi:DMSO/TMAO reductase YedYZ molybdopterin-dependent catalytic subunit|nr:molybdopterin-dependent oxidoreductase [Bryobacteraceae bacterium]
MTKLSRRAIMTGGLATAGVASVAAATKIAQRYGLVPPDHGGIYGPGETLTYAAQRVLTSHSRAREFSRDQISTKPFANEIALPGDEYNRLRAGGFADWRLKVEGMVARPASFSIAELKGFPAGSQITQIACEEGWSYVAEWSGTPLSKVLNAAGVLPQARYAVYYSIDRNWWESVDMADALHPQTLIAYGMNGEDIPVGFGGPLRMRVPRQLGYKSVKFITRIVLTDDLKKFGKGLGSASPEGGYAWYAGI